ncbi:pyrroline-5-carboxylate reductase, partial [Salmonella enterica subsp. enterica serovar Virchow]|nr:pyrroline-5-carboxylate reductase [Salmonella enterica subsp. enterica serovar Virchow]
MGVDVVLVGCGNMGYAMLAGWLKGGKLKPGEVAVVEPTDALRERAAKLGVTAVADAGALPPGSPSIIVIAVKPQVIKDVLKDYAALGDGAATFVSVAAGTTIASFEQILGPKTPVLRCMPNTPAAIGKGMMVTFANGNVTPAAQARIADLLSASGAVAAIPSEDLMDAVTAVSGSGPAYVFHFIEALTKAAESVGLPADVAKLLAMQTVYGAANLAKESTDEPGELRRQVTSPNGTTQAGLE